MNPARYRMLENGQTNIARKVLACVPIQEMWHKNVILSEVPRNGSRIDKNIFEGCISALLDTGLIKEPSRHHYQRVHVHAEEEPKKVPMPSKPAPKSSKPEDPLSRLASLASKLRAIADEAEELALDIEATKTTNDEELEKLRTLKTLLKGL